MFFNWRNTFEFGSRNIQKLRSDVGVKILNGSIQVVLIRSAYRSDSLCAVCL